MLLASAPITKNDSLKKVIQQLYQKNDILSINKIINKNDFDEIDYPLSILTKNLEISKKKNNPDWLADTYQYLGIFWAQKGNNKKAYDYFFNSETAAKEAGNIQKEGQSILNQANVTANLDEKIIKYKKSINILKTQKDTLSLLKLYLNMGYVYYEKYKSTKNQDSLSYFQNQSTTQYNIAKNLNQNFNNLEMKSLIYNREALWYKERKLYDEAIHYFTISKNILEPNKLTRIKVFSDINIAEIYLEQKNFPLFIKTLSQAESEAKNQGIDDYLLNIYKDFKNYYLQSGETEKALQYTQKFYDLEISQTEKNNEDELKLIELENEIKGNEISLHQMKVKQRNYALFFGVVALLLLILCFAIYLLWKNNKRKLINIEKDKKIIEVELENKHLRELVLTEKDELNQQYLNTFVKQTNNIEAFLDGISLKLKQASVLTQADINQVKVDFSNLTNLNSEIKNITTISKSNLQEVIIKIKNQYPEITTADINLISLLYEGFNSKEIANTLNISLGSVNTKRYRLRKKLKIENDDSFDDFFKNTTTQN